MNLFALLLAQNEDAAGALGALLGSCCCPIFISLIFVVPLLAGLWKIFEKAGQPGWAAIVPIYNLYVLNEIARKDILWFILALLPCINFVAIIIIWMDVAKNFGKDPIYGLGLAFLGPIFSPLLGFSDAKYQPPPRPMM